MDQIPIRSSTEGGEEYGADNRRGGVERQEARSMDVIDVEDLSPERELVPIKG